MKLKMFIIVSLLFLLTSCADAVSFAQAEHMNPVGLWYGLWHGMIAVIAWIVSLFSDSVAVYAIYNNGGWYDFGFLLGVGAFSSILTRRA